MGSVTEREAIRSADAAAADVVPVAALRPLVERWIAMFDTPEDAYQALEAASRFTADAWRKRLTDKVDTFHARKRGRAGQLWEYDYERRGWWSYEALDVADVDELLTAMGATELWHTELAAWAGLRALRCEDCGKSIEPGDYRPLDLFRPQPGAPGGVVWNATVQKWVVRAKAAKAGGRRFRRYDLCRRCAGEALRARAAKSPKVGHKGRGGVLRRTDRVEPKRGGRPRLLTDEQLHAAHVVYLRGERSMRQLAADLALSLGTGTAGGYASALYYGWRRLMLPTRSRGEAMTLMHRDVLGHEIGRRAAQTAGKRRCAARTTSVGKNGGQPCGQWATAASDLCAMHERYGTVPRAERRPRCTATTQAGGRCRRSPLPGRDVCDLHLEGSETARRMAERLRGTSRTQRPENLTRYASVQPALRAYLAWAADQPRPANQTTGRPPTWCWLVDELDGRLRTELRRYASGDPDARMLRETAAAIIAAVDRVIGRTLAEAA